MALTNNLVLTKKDHDALSEALEQRQPGDKVTLHLEVTLVENLTDRASFDVDKVTSAVGRDAPAADVPDTPADASIADSVLGVMGKKAKAA